MPTRLRFWMFALSVSVSIGFLAGCESNPAGPSAPNRPKSPRGSPASKAAKSKVVPVRDFD